MDFHRSVSTVEQVAAWACLSGAWLMHYSLLRHVSGGTNLDD
jgi:hypothetical protein